jgi:hypothetical protein
MVKTKGGIITPVAQLVEAALEEESAIWSERFKRNPPERGQFWVQKNKDVHWVKNERKEVRESQKGVKDATRKGISQEIAESLLSASEKRVCRHVGKQASELPGTLEVDVSQRKLRVER